MKLRTLFPAMLAACAVAVAAGCGGDRPGSDIVFVSSRGGDYVLYGMDADGGAEGRLTGQEPDGAATDGFPFEIHPAWSPDGSRIAFASARSGSFDLYVMDADGESIRRLTTSEDDDGHPTWSPDGRRIAFQRGDEGHIFVMSADGGDARRVTDDLAPESDPAWSPDGRWIAYSRRQPGTDLREIWLAAPDGSERRRLTTLSAAAYGPAWSPDGSRLAFSANRGGGRFDIYTIGVGGDELRRAVRSAEDAFEPTWSPDGEILAFSRGGAIVTIDREGNEVQLTDPDNNDSSPAWNPSPPAGEEES